MYLPHLILPLTLLSSTSALKIASSLQWIEHTPQPYAIANFYKGSSAATLSSGGVANLASDPSIGTPSAFSLFPSPFQTRKHLSEITVMQS